MLYYVLAAETGIEVSQTNLAHICEERPVSKCVLLRIEALRLRMMNWGFREAKLVTWPKY